MQLTMVTGNEERFRVAAETLREYGVSLLRENIPTPELQDLDVQKVAEFSALSAAATLGRSVIKADAGYYITSLNGFPGPLVKFANQWFSAQDILRLMDGHTDRSVVLRECVAFASVDGTMQSFISESRGVIAQQAHGSGSSFDTILIRDGQTVTQGSMTRATLRDLFSQQLTHYHQLGQSLRESQLR